MLRSIRRSDVPSVFPILSRNFPEEHELLGWDRPTFEGVLYGMFRPGPRFALGLLRLLGRAPFEFVALDVDGALAAGALLTFPGTVGYLSTVFVDAPFRRRGYAQKVLAVADAKARRRGRRTMVLDVLAFNVPARTLYAKLGYRRLRGQVHLVRDAPADAAPTPTSSAVRPFHRRDAAPLVPLASATLPPEVAELLPITPASFAVAGPILAALDSTSAAWVVGPKGGARAYVRATSSAATHAAHLGAPVVAPNADPAEIDALLRTAVAWTAREGHPRAVVEVPDHNPAALEALGRAGFREAYRAETLVLDL